MNSFAFISYHIHSISYIYSFYPCLFYCCQPLCVISQQSWFGLFLFHKLSNLLPQPTTLYSTTGTMCHYSCPGTSMEPNHYAGFCSDDGVVPEWLDDLACGSGRCFSSVSFGFKTEFVTNSGWDFDLEGVSFKFESEKEGFAFHMNEIVQIEAGGGGGGCFVAFNHRLLSADRVDFGLCFIL